MATSIEESVVHANWVIDTLHGEILDLPIVFDWEEWTSFSNYHLNLQDINDIALAFIDTIENQGYKGMLYSSKNYLEKVWNAKQYPSIWLAHYTKQTNYQGTYKLWQLTDSAIIDGINGPVDVNILYL